MNNLRNCTFAGFYFLEKFIFGSWRVVCMLHYYLPILCHEVAHNIRYDNQNDRNRLVAAYILDNFSYNLIHSILSVECCELLEREKLREMQQLLKQEITDVLFPV